MIIHSLKLLGALFYHNNSKADCVEMVNALVNEKILRQETLNALLSIQEGQFHHDFSVLFEGIGDMPVPPWGSVYLDKEQVLFGDSNVRYRLFLNNNGITLDSGQREPEDQFGLMLLACAYFLEQNQKAAAHELVGEHLMPWANTYLEQLSAKAPNAFYRALATDVQQWLHLYISQHNISVTEQKIYLNE